MEKNPFFSEINGNFGFGCMRLPTMKDGDIDYAEMNKMVDAFLGAGFNYFDTAHMYMDEKSEVALRECLVKRYPRDRYIFTNKLSHSYIHKEADVLPLFEKQLAACGVEYFDFYLIHAVTAEFYDLYQRCRSFEIAQDLKHQGKVRHVGMSFHDSPELLERVLTEHPEIEVVQIQFNYADYDAPAIQSGANYKVLEKFNKPVLVMEPIKGGGLVNLPDGAKKILDDLHGGSYASYAIRYAASFPKVAVVLSGMGSMAMMEDNLSFMKEFQPLSQEEMNAVDQVREILKHQDTIPCTACRYCTDGCPKRIAIPDLFSCYNAKKQYKDWNSEFYYHQVYTKNNGKASDCIKCGHCERECPQHLKIRDLLTEVAGVFEKGSD